MSASLANDSRARPKVLESSTTDMVSSERSPERLALRTCNRMQPDGNDIADNDRPGAVAGDLDRVGGKLTERAAPHLLLRLRRVDDDRRRRPRRPAVVDQPAGNRRRPAQAHQDHDGDAVWLQSADRRRE